MKLCYFITLVCKKLQLSDFQTQNFWAVFENLHKLFSACLLPLFQSVFELQVLVLISVAFICRRLLWDIPKEKTPHVVRSGDWGDQGIFPKRSTTRLGANAQIAVLKALAVLAVAPSWWNHWFSPLIRCLRSSSSRKSQRKRLQRKATGH